ncbi:unnamed protein product [Ilex paraguariensis]|uniref:Phenylalanyl-tRNA synthetase domain-containing protein n=1 Tax=Ilex paraguariensis TaxID=185542 RepID=A0ABC8QVK1_9AQUA
MALGYRFQMEKWLEVLGCGVTEQEILKRSGKMDNVAWAFGLGLERLAMVLFDIPDIRLFWSNDERFTSQFSKGQLGVKFKTFSKYPPCYKDMSFWISDSFTENNLCEVVRGIAGDLVEEAKLSYDPICLRGILLAVVMVHAFMDPRQAIFGSAKAWLAKSSFVCSSELTFSSKVWLVM